MSEAPQKPTPEERIELLATNARNKLAAEIKKRRKLIDNLNSDLEKHGDPDRWKRYGDLILANLNSAERCGDTVLVTDYFDDAVPVIEIAGERNRSLNEIAEGYFRSYTKARNGKRVITERISITEAAIKDAQAKLSQIDTAVADLNEDLLISLTTPKQKIFAQRTRKKVEQGFKGARRFVSSDGFEILVGKKAKDNDFLTFRVAKSLDLWLHAADYPGSHVVIRIPGKKLVPDRTLIEAAQLAAFYSDAREQPKAAVRYTQKKFVNKPKRAAPGLVSLSSFKTVLVEPQVAVELIRDENN
jgi:predicted ribosome quality control (RQC) complex YloA/Tae2 family protein